MSKFEYVTPNKTTVRRLFVDDNMKKDKYEIIAGDEVLTVVSFKEARGYWIGRLSLDEVLKDAQ